MKVLIIDNYDSFTYNIVEYIRKCSQHEPTVVRNDCTTDHSPSNFSHIILSPGPGLPDEAADLKEIICQWHRKIPMLGICLGMQAMGEFFGGKLQNLQRVYHGVQGSIRQIAHSPLFEDVPPEFLVGRYHSWVVEKASLPNTLKVTAEDNSETVMAFEHISYPVYGVQFHPESILTPEGLRMIENFLKITPAPLTGSQP